MSKSHTVKLTITNNTNQEMNYQSDSFDSGRLADGGSWPANIASGKSEIIECCEKDWSAVGCSGYVNYSLGDGIVTLAFSNPTVGENKLGVGVGNKQVWNRIEGHKYEPFIEQFEIGSQRYFAACQCTGGKINNASIALSALAILPYNPNATMEFNVIQYNVFARPDNPKLLGYEGKEERLPKIPEALAQLNEGKVDIITLNEVFSQVGTPLCDQMLNEFKKYGFPYHTRVLDGGMLEKVGGVMIVSKWPLHADTYIYSDMPTRDNEDISVGLGEKIVAKGVVYAAVKKTEKGFTKTFHIFATHMRAWNSQTARETRQKQAKQMKEFVEAKNIPNNEPIFFAGDFNVDFVRCASELSDLAQILDAKLPELKGEQKYTSDPSSNILVGKDSAAKACLEAYKSSWGEKKENVYHPIPQVKNPTPPNPPISERDSFFAEPKKDSKLYSFFADPTKEKETLYIEEGGCYASCCLHEWLDYILFSNRHQQPLNTPTLECIRLKASSPFEASWLWIDPPSIIEVVGKELFTSTPKPDKIITSDLSDHYPVFSRFVFSA